MIKSLNKKIENQLQNNNKKDRIINFEKFNIFSRNNLTNETIFLKDNIDILLDEKIKNYNQDKHDIRNHDKVSLQLEETVSVIFGAKLLSVYNMFSQCSVFIGCSLMPTI